MSPASEDGYATPAAAVISMAIAVVVASVVARSLSELKLARAELKRTQIEYQLAGAQDGAMLAIATSSRPPPYRWTLASLGQAVQVTAEPERIKLSPRALAATDETLFARLGVDDADAATLRAHLSVVGVENGFTWLAEEAAARPWRACVGALASPFGRAEQLTARTYDEPQAGQQDAHWRAGEVWRISVTDMQGWREERIVRFTGNGLNPAAVVARRLTRGWDGGEKCDSLFDAGLGA